MATAKRLNATSYPEKIEDAAELMFDGYDVYLDL